ncbi:hypothetical protein tb265_49830 [Gemmatimonadetes bacterium T265]|nr:hypothetical protein tb265_49830 [Gemmatimonadetes bacterium T265]
MPNRPAAPRRVALLDPVGDAGIGGYTHELAQALAGAGVDACVYSTPAAFARALPRAYPLVPAFGERPLDAPALARARAVTLGSAPAPPAPAGPPAPGSLDAYCAALRARGWGGPRRRAAGAPRPAARHATGPARLRAADAPAASPHATALVDHLCDAGFDAVWTQWPVLDPYPGDTRRACARRGVRVVHTVHNVLPHERAPDDADHHARAYADADVLVVHSRQAAAALEAAFPTARGRTVVARHGTYSIYPRVPGARAHLRAHLDLPPDATIVLFFGGVRPYKNLDAVTEALAAPGCDDLVLVVAGWEWGGDGGSPDDRLARTRRRVAAAGLDPRVRLLPGPFGVQQTAELFEAADIVALPYLESSGSGVLCLAMTFGRHVLCTATGGMAEYVADYPRATLLERGTPAAVGAGLRAAAVAVGADRGDGAACPTPHLAWPHIVRGLLPALATPAVRHLGD